mmetsp:Transcript_31028/g.46506  ORF Transcript_31028/g.46506 Transcript_31028/m.46506 type:complete len:570 (-) Transcript_31028:119-1828(-)
MAFDQHIEADQVGDDGIGLFSSIIARPILWLLGGDQDKTAEESRKEERQQLERDISGASDVNEDGTDNDGNGVDNDRCEGGPASSFTCATNRNGDNSEQSTIDKGGDSSNGRGSNKRGDNGNNISQMSPTQKSWPQVGAMGTSTSMNSPPTRREDYSATKMVDDLVAVMERNSIDQKSNDPATSAITIRCELSYSANSLSASHSASEFPSQEMSSKPPLHKAHSSNSIRSKKTSWSDERGNRPLVEYSDDHLETVESQHWTQLRRKKRSCSLDNGDGKRSSTRRSQARVIKSALRSGSYSPPVTKMYARGGETSSSHSTSSSNQAASGEQMRSFHSLSMIGSSSGSSCSDSISASASSNDSLDNVQCVPSTLQQGGGRVNGGLIIPRGGPSAAYHLTMGTRAEPQAQVAANENQSEGGDNVPTTTTNNLVNGRMQPKAPSPHHHMFLPHPPTGHMSPQYGFYVNITPPTTLHAASRKRGSPLRPFEESSPQQQSFRGFSPFLPSPIPEVELAKETGGAPTLAPLSESLESSAGKNRLNMKPSFPKNRVAMGMVLAGNHHHHAWPSIPMG